MKIIILGAGQVGGALAASLVNEAIDIAVVDTDQELLQGLRDRLDIQTVHGDAAHPSVLKAAGLADAEILIAATGSDEINIVACQIAHTLAKTPTKICRIRSTDFVNEKELFKPGGIAVDVLISPEKVITEHVIGLLEFPGTLQVLNFASDLVRIVAIRAHAGDKFIGESLLDITRMTPNQDARVAAVYRGDRAIKPTRDTIIEPLDEVFYVAATKNIRPVMQELGQLSRPYHRIMIAGGGNIGLGLAKKIENDYSVKIIERNKSRAQYIAAELNKALVLRGISSDADLLRSESIEDVDVFIALTNDDEANIMSSLLAKKMGARKVITLIANPAYVELVQGEDIDVAFAPQVVTIGDILKHVRRGDIGAVHSLRRGAAEVLEIVAHGDSRSSKVIGRRIDEITLPENVRFGAIVRGKKVMVAHRNVVIEDNDHVIVFLSDKSQIPVVEQLFSVGLGFF